MTVKELKRILARFPRNAEVAIQMTNEHKTNNVIVVGQVNESNEWAVIIKEVNAQPSDEKNKDPEGSNSN